MYTTAICDELRQVERDVVEGERRLAEQEALVIELKRQDLDTAKAEAELERCAKSSGVAIRIVNVCSHGCNPEGIAGE